MTVKQYYNKKVKRWVKINVTPGKRARIISTSKSPYANIPKG